MEKIKPYLGIILVVAAAVALIVLFTVRKDGTSATEVITSDGETVEVTPLSKMRVRTAEDAPEIDADTYRLEVHGLVQTDLSLSFDEIQQMEAEERYVELPCVEGWTEKATWRGPRLADLLQEAGVEEGAYNVVFSSPGGYTTSLTLDDIEETDPLLAYEVNGEALPEEQGFPVRLVVPDKLGYKWIKWVTGIELIAGTYEGFWESRGYDNEADAADRWTPE